MFYAFYAPAKASSLENKKVVAEHWSGELELRGLDSKSYKVVDYVNNKDYGTVHGPDARLRAEFTGSLLLQVTPQ